jgi:hypothetical protein
LVHRGGRQPGGLAEIGEAHPAVGREQVHESTVEAFHGHRLVADAGRNPTATTDEVRVDP